MTAPRGQKPPTASTANGRAVPSPRPPAKPSIPPPPAKPSIPPTPAKPSISPPPAKPSISPTPAKAPIPPPAAKAPPPPAQVPPPAAKPLGARRMLGLGEATGALRFLGRVALRHPRAALQTAPALGQELLKISSGRSQIAPEKGDRRFADPAWQQNPLFKATMQTYLTWGSGLDRYIDNLGLDGAGVERLRFAATLVREAVAPVNFLAANPAAIKRAIDTGGGSVRRGLANWAGDLRHNHGMPSMVDRRPFTIGENLAATPGSVIYRNEVFELIQYAPQAETVYDRPLLVVPPQVNKYYALDLAPGRSMYEYLLTRGIPVYGISWRNPTRAQRDWNFDTYVQATIDAVDVIRQVSGSPDVNIMGGCLGGMTAALAQSHLAARDDHRIHSVTMTVTLLDCDSDGRMFLFATPQLLALAKQVSRPAGVINGWQLGSTFAWLRPNDLVWNYWVNNYLLGQDPPAFDILAWNADTTRLSTAFHRQLMDMVAANQMVHPGAMTVLGTPVDLSRIGCDTYVAAGLTDHITPWKTCYRSTQLVSGHAEFVLCSSGHIQTVVADPKHRGLGYFVNPATPPSADDWLAAAERHEGSWWEHWAGWLAQRSGEPSAAPHTLGSTRYPPIEPAPGSYVRQ
jgi:polyhydroxyalkanoate synthase subunit PhaC